MAKIISRASDLSGEFGAETFTLTPVIRLDKITVDVTDREREDLDARYWEFTDAVFALYGETFGDVLEVVAALNAAGSQTTGGSASKSSVTGNADVVRVWARENGYEVADRGRIKSDVLDAYKAANSDKVTDLDTPADEPTDAELAELESENV